MADKNSLFGKTVNCCGYFRSKSNSYYLNIENDCNYTKKGNYTDYNACFQRDSWLYCPSYSYKEYAFSGVVVNIKLYSWIYRYGLHLTDNIIHTCWTDINNIELATVYYENGKKKLVPLSCIKEYNLYDEGLSIKKTEDSISRVNKELINPATIILKSNGSFELEVNYLKINSYDEYPIKKTRKIIFDFEKHEVIGETQDWIMNVDNKTYDIAMEHMQNQIQEKFGIRPRITYGRTNFEKLVNYNCFPFGPILNTFKPIFKPFDNFQNYDYKENLLDNLSNDPNCIIKFINLCGLQYSSFYNKLLLQDKDEFAEYIWIKECGFTEEVIIQEIINSDNKRAFAKEFFTIGRIGLSKIDQKSSLFCKNNNSNHTLIEYSKQLIEKFGQQKTLKIIKDLIPCYSKKDSIYSIFECCALFLQMIDSKQIIDKQIKKIINEGLTDYNIKMIKNNFITNKDFYMIEYSSDEKELEWNYENYNFKLPESTKTLIKIGNEMNNCVGNYYTIRVLRKKCIIVYVLKNEKYQICIELRRNENGKFYIWQERGKNNKSLTADEKRVVIEWVHNKNID